MKILADLESLTAESFEGEAVGASLRAEIVGEVKSTLGESKEEEHDNCGVDLEAVG